MEKDWGYARDFIEEIKDMKLSPKIVTMSNAITILQNAINLDDNHNISLEANVRILQLQYVTIYIIPCID